jgi:hypothetical protein
MPWKEISVYEKRMKFVVAWKQGGWSMTDLAGKLVLVGLQATNTSGSTTQKGSMALRTSPEHLNGSPGQFGKRWSKCRPKSIIDLAVSQEAPANWWLKLGINLERIEPGKPQQNGRHERMHRTLKQATALPPKSSLDAQQRAFDLFLQEYNYERPHEALRDKLPSELYKRSTREYPEQLSEIAYGTNMETCRVNDAGNIGYGGHRVFISGALDGEIVGLEEISERHARIHLANVALGVIDLFTGKVLQYRNPMPTEPL